ncbi:redoxin domain-containing protein [Thalassomonas viridans]|uniref:thioredoxin-dependent peroxiredoxin n=1 Tax=Thalassomonas viridans TaxID=137584 RepID=A0AAE9Z4Z8_9GAMM|nr:redoxin domain-containing protein [Thalassomonas viridans]WDE06185.1 redoxin domain-containing protein [Thalassomonas viridans]
MKKLILPLILLNVLGGVGSGIMLWLSNGNLMWLGSFLTTFPLPFLLMVLTNAFGIARTSARLPFIQLLSIAGLVLAGLTLLEMQGSQTTSDFVAVGLTVFGALFVQWYVWSFSSYGRKKSKSIVKGRTLPELQLHRLDGSSVSSSSFVGSKTLLVFFRANWCPFCVNQLKEVLARADKLKRSGIQVKFISNQGTENSKQLTEKLALPAHFEILQDDDLKAAKALGIADIGGLPAGMSGYPEDTVMATVITLDEKGAVTFGDETDNYRVRPHPDTFLPAFGG